MYFCASLHAFPLCEAETGLIVTQVTCLLRSLEVRSLLGKFLYAFFFFILIPVTLEHQWIKACLKFGGGAMEVPVFRSQAM